MLAKRSLCYKISDMGTVTTAPDSVMLTSAISQGVLEVVQAMLCMQARKSRCKGKYVALSGPGAKAI